MGVPPQPFGAREIQVKKLTEYLVAKSCMESRHRGRLHFDVGERVRLRRRARRKPRHVDAVADAHDSGPSAPDAGRHDQVQDLLLRQQRGQLLEHRAGQGRQPGPVAVVEYGHKLRLYQSVGERVYLCQRIMREPDGVCAAYRNPLLVKYLGREKLPIQAKWPN